jgi:hypothetical protein
MKVLHLPLGGKSTVLEISGSLESLQKLVGGNIEVAPQPSTEYTIYCNEEGKLLGLPVNGKAQQIWQALWRTDFLADYLAGDIFITGGVDEEGNEQSLTDEQIKELQGFLTKVGLE